MPGCLRNRKPYSCANHFPAAFLRCLSLCKIGKFGLFFDIRSVAVVSQQFFTSIVALNPGKSCRNIIHLCC